MGIVSLLPTLRTLERPNLIIKFSNGKKEYLKIFRDVNKNKNQIVVINNDENGNFVSTTMPVNKDTNYIIKEINKGQIIYKNGQTGVKNDSATNSIITDNAKNLNPNYLEENAPVELDEIDKELYDIQNVPEPKTTKELSKIFELSAWALFHFCPPYVLKSTLRAHY